MSLFLIKSLFCLCDCVSVLFSRTIQLQNGRNLRRRSLNDLFTLGNKPTQFSQRCCKIVELRICNGKEKSTNADRRIKRGEREQGQKYSALFWLDRVNIGFICCPCLIWIIYGLFLFNLKLLQVSALVAAIERDSAKQRESVARALLKSVGT